MDAQIHVVGVEEVESETFPILRTIMEERRYALISTYRVWRFAADTHLSFKEIEDAWNNYCKARDVWLAT